MSSATLTINSIYSSYPGGKWDNALVGQVWAGNVYIKNADGSKTLKNVRTKLSFTVNSDLQIGSCTSLVLKISSAQTSYPKHIQACIAPNNVDVIGNVLNSVGTYIDTNYVGNPIAHSSAYQDTAGKNQFTGWTATSGSTNILHISLPLL